MTEKSDQTGGASPGGEHPILVAVDFTPDSAAAVLWACEFADCAKAPIHVLHVVHDPENDPGHYRRGDSDELRPMADAAAEMLDNFLAELRAKKPKSAALEKAKPVLVTGIPETRILEVAQRDAARIIVMGSRGRTGLPHLLLGSKAERVVQRSPIPVTIVKAEGEDE